MVVKIFPEAERNMNQIYLFCYRKFNKKIALEARRSIRKQLLLRGSNPHLGPIEPLLNHRPETWRSLVVHPHAKAIYLIGAKTVNIAALWDTRRNPATIGNYLDHLVQTQPTVVCEPLISYSPTPEISNNETPPPKPLQ